MPYVEINGANILVTGGAGGPYTVTFINALGKRPVAEMTASGAGLTGGAAPSVAVATTTQGASEIVVGVVEAIPAETTPIKGLRVG